jgi:hypothetical protein
MPCPDASSGWSQWRLNDGFRSSPYTVLPRKSYVEGAECGRVNRLIRKAVEIMRNTAPILLFTVNVPRVTVWSSVVDVYDDQAA